MSLEYTEIKKAFDQIDTDKSGALELDEIMKLAKDLGEEASPQQILEIFGEIDENNDRKISFNEFLSWYRFGKDIPIARVMKAHIAIMNGIEVARKQMEKLDDGNLEGDGR